ncbi:hypothetical protein SRRS_18270 [Sporomusa rhizae]|uniref:OmpH family outer membrane protein n=1 Tax=Sporomusa rhizae TaxID=357999 RepID=UPI00352B1764
MKKIIVSFIVITLLTIGTALAAEPSTEMNRIGVIDVSIVMQQSPQVREFQRQLNEKGKELTNQLQVEKPNLSAEEFKKKQEAAYADFLRVKVDLEKQIDEKVKQAIVKVAKEKNLIMVLYKNSIIFGGTNVIQVDITQDVINNIE